jgi:hypothetical protein
MAKACKSFRKHFEDYNYDLDAGDDKQLDNAKEALKQALATISEGIFMQNIGPEWELDNYTEGCSHAVKAQWEKMTGGEFDVPNSMIHQVLLDQVEIALCGS